MGPCGERRRVAELEERRRELRRVVPQVPLHGPRRALGVRALEEEGRRRRAAVAEDRRAAAAGRYPSSHGGEARVDVEGHVGGDGRYYVIDCARVFPPESPVVAR